jgi:cobyrinic acid a,c-diamide synthase
MIAGGGSGSGKTTLSCALLALFARRGLKTSAFKCGPDYIDPMFHRETLNTHSANLDLFMMDEETVRRLLLENSVGRDIALIEGVMGFYDGVGGNTADASSWHLSEASGTPVLFVENCKGRSLTMAAQIKGILEFRRNNIRAVLLNNTSADFFKTLKPAIEKETGLPVAGFLPYMPECSIESRHLGLVTAAEIENLRGKIERLADGIEKTVDLDTILSIAASAPSINPVTAAALPPLMQSAQSVTVMLNRSEAANVSKSVSKAVPPPVMKASKMPKRSKTTRRPRIGVARDKAFCFYYEDSLNLLKKLGAELVDFSPLAGKSLPSGLNALILGGGYPELYAAQLSENKAMLAAIRKAVNAGIPAIAECGGFMYLHRELEGADGKIYSFAGVIDAVCEKKERLVRFGYAEFTANVDNLLRKAGETLRGHEFHYWDSARSGDSFTAVKPVSGKSWRCIITTETLFAGFPHFHFCSAPEAAERFIKNL